MTDDPRAELRRTLGEQAGPVLDRLSAAQAAELLACYRDAAQRRRDTLAQAQESSLRLVPALLRPAVRKVLGG